MQKRAQMRNGNAHTHTHILTSGTGKRTTHVQSLVSSDDGATRITMHMLHVRVYVLVCGT